MFRLKRQTWFSSCTSATFLSVKYRFTTAFQSCERVWQSTCSRLFLASLGFGLVLSFRCSERKTYLAVAFLSAGFAFTLRCNPSSRWCVHRARAHSLVHALCYDSCFLVSSTGLQALTRHSYMVCWVPWVRNRLSSTAKHSNKKASWIFSIIGF